MAVHTPDNITCRQFAAAVKRDPFADLEGPLRCVAIGRPFLSKFRVEAHVVPNLDEPIVHGVGTGVVDA